MLLPIESAADNIQVCWDYDSAVSPLPLLGPRERDLNVALYVYFDLISNTFIHHA